jgi:hypothetical protein
MIISFLNPDQNIQIFQPTLNEAFPAFLIEHSPRQSNDKFGELVLDALS